jgi:hypothetical protein
MLHRNISVVVIESCSWTTRYKVFAPVFANRVMRPLMVLQCARPCLANRSRARRPNRSFAGAETTLPWLMPAGAYVLLLALGPRLLSNPDTYSHFALGRWILDHHSVPTTDPFSANFRGTHWVPLEWLSQIAFAGAHAVGGWLGVIALTAAAVATALGLLTRFLLRDWQRARRVLADGATHTRAASHPRATGDGRLDRHIDLRRRHSCRSALACFATDDAVAQSPRQLHVRSGNDCADRARRALACAAFGSTDRFPAVVLIRAPRVRHHMPEPVRTRNESGDVPHSRPGRSLDDRRRVALAGFYPSRCV